MGRLDQCQVTRHGEQPSSGWLTVYRRAAHLVIGCQAAFSILIAGGITWGFYRAGPIEWSMLARPPYPQALGRTVWFSLISAIATMTVGYPLALAIRRRAFLWRTALALSFLPLCCSPLIILYGWLAVFQQSGPLARLISLVGLRPPSWLTPGSLAVCIVMTYLLLPHFVVPALLGLFRVPETFVIAAKSLGATNWQIQQRIIVPLAGRGIWFGLGIVFVQGLGFYVTPVLLGGGKVVTVSTLLDDRLNYLLDWSTAAVLAAVLCGTAIIALWSIIGLSRRLVST